MALQIDCPRCEKRLPSSATFCRRCGVRVAQRFSGVTFRPPPAAKPPSTTAAARIGLVGLGVSAMVVALLSVPSMNETPQPARVYPSGGVGSGGGGGIIPSASSGYSPAPTPTPMPTPNWPYSPTAVREYSPPPPRPYYAPRATYGPRPSYSAPYGGPYGNTPYGNPYGPQSPSGPGGPPPSPGGRGR